MVSLKLFCKILMIYYEDFSYRIRLYMNIFNV